MTNSPGRLRLDRVDGPPIDPIEFAPVDGGEPQELGRSASCAVVLAHASVSRRHTSIDHADGSWRIADLGSSNGTYLNGVRLDGDERVRLGDGDLVRLGVWEFVARLPEQRQEAAPRTPVVLPRRSDETYATRASIFLRLCDGQSEVRELGWQEFADRYGPIIVGFARNAGLRSQESDDVLQDVLLGFFRAADAFEYDPTRGRFRGYLKRVTLNAIRARWRRDKIKVAGDPGLLDDIAGTDVAWDHEWAKQVLRRALDEVCRQFEPRTIEAFDLYGRRGLSVAAVAAQLEMSAESVRHAKSRVSRALREIIERLRCEEGEPSSLDDRRPDAQGG